MIANGKRTRAKNFTMGEELILEYLVLQHKDVVCSQKSGADVWRKKKDTWKQIAADFAVQSGIERPWQALRDKHINSTRLKRVKGLNEMGNKTTFNDTDSQRDLSNSAVSTISGAVKDEESSSDFDPEYESKNTFRSTSSEPPYEQDNSNFSTSKVKVKSVNDLRKEEATNILTDEKLNLLKVQQTYYRNENSRAAEQHKVEMEKQRIELEQRKVELEQYKLDLERFQVELQGKRLKNKLLEMEILEKQGNIKDSKETT
ncbi:uncharacterized protein LOC128262824 [Drosophila gunungcola]|uniref:Regulatory protein zeste n=1 Tax=Drosophila gunungcola TaxID=103775 RepID=A0A9Q0BSS1_9MUSC|nr:uncharacterized protein LOC128262824 [Drosophila gunungcola]XP_052853326.1 uncharacterized protein LOC128262824 [Drosophila gunungcola]XP_052853327.1 uncharacterized protein LOC128262824 [Drosophila gunungcola]KAI8042469.1 hypothetical protein M5D96_003782 [Drosophila gunungcola]